MCRGVSAGAHVDRRSDANSMTTVDETIRSVLKAQGRLAVDPEALGDKDDLYTSGLTSHSSVNVMLSLENEFNVEFPVEMLTKATFQSIWSVRTALAKLGVNDGA
jgi:acyl carrier protein